jgi:hypothetical protein
VAQQTEEILDEDVLGIRARLRRDARRRVAAVIVGDDAIPAREVAHLGLPGAMIAAELVAPHERSARARLLVVQVDAVHLAMDMSPRSTRAHDEPAGAAR